MSFGISPISNPCTLANHFLDTGKIGTIVDPKTGACADRLQSCALKAIGYESLGNTSIDEQVETLPFR